MSPNVPVMYIKRLLIILIGIIILTTNVPAGINTETNDNYTEIDNIAPLPLPEAIIQNDPEVAPLNAQPRSWAPDYNDVLVIYNNQSQISEDIAFYFQSQRNIPNINMCNISTVTNEEINRATFDTIRSQVENYITNNGLEDTINYIVTTKGVPLKVTGGGDTYASVDAELTMILGAYKTYIGNYRTFPNTYYGSWTDFTNRDYDIYLVTRLTGYDFNDVKSLIDNAAASYGQQGTFVLDFDPTKEDDGTKERRNDYLQNADTILSNKGFSVKFNGGASFLIDETDVAGYASWGSRDGEYFSGAPHSNGGFENDGNSDGMPDGWIAVEDPNGTVYKDSSETRGTWSTLSVKLSRNETNQNYTYLYQNITIKADTHYYFVGYIKYIGITAGDGAFLQMSAFDGTNQMVWQYNASKRTGTTNNWPRMNDVSYDPIPGVTKVQIALVLSKSSGNAYFDDVGLYEVKPHNTWEAGALAETFTFYSAYTFTNPPWARYSSYIADLIHEGVTGASGYVYYEPHRYVHVDMLFNRYTEGYSLADCYYAASDYLGWTEVIVGDPKVRPYFEFLPDLNLDADDITFSKPMPNHGETFEISAKVYNIGGRDASNVNVSFYLDEITIDNWLGSNEFSNIGKDGSKTAKINWDTSKNTAGDHKIVVRIDPSGNIRERNETNNIANQSIHINAIPKLNAFIFSDNSVFRTQNITISANATDAETPSNQIECELLYKHSSLGDEPVNWSIITKRKYNVNGECWDYVFEPGSDWKLGSYSFQVQFEDTDTGLSNWHKSTNAVNVKNNAPTITDLWLTKVNYTRMDKVTIHLDANDIEDFNDVDLEFQYRHTKMVSSPWNIITSENITKMSSSSTEWEAYIPLNTSVKLGSYDIKIGITDNDDTTVSQDRIEAFNVVNVGPEINAIYISSTDVYRTTSIYINVDVDDLEDLGPDLTCEIQYTMQIAPVEEDWDSLYVAEIHWDGTENMFVGRFHPTPSAPVGIYYIRARVSDDDDEVSNWLAAIDHIEVKNNLPVISMEDFPAIVNEDEEVNFDAGNSSDIESKLLYYIWDFGDGSAFSADKVTTHTFSESGIFNISLTVEDQDKGSSVVYRTIEVYNVIPIADGYVDKDTAVVGETITFYGEKSYDTASDTNLTYIWDFDDGSDPEEGKVVSHTYTTATRYFVTLTVTDEDGGESEKDTIMLVINPSGDNITGTTDGFDMFTWGIIIIGIVLIIAISMLFIWLRKKNAKDQKLVNAVKPNLLGAPEGLNEPDVIARPGAMAVSSRGPQPDLETPTVTVVTPTVVGSGPEQQYEEPSIYEPTLPGAAGSVGTLPDEKPQKSKKKGKGGEEPEVITPDIEYAPEVPTELDIAPGQTAELPKGKSDQPTEVLIPEELGAETPTVVPTVAETPQGSKPTKKLKKRAPKVVKK